MRVFFGLLLIFTGFALNVIRVRSGLPVGLFGNWFPVALQFLGFLLVGLKVAELHQRMHEHE
jgi:hypothetical protein